MSIHNEIKAIILRALPSLTEEIREHVITSLERSGVESIEDLVYVQQEDLKDVLPIIQQRKLLEAFKLETTKVTLDLQILPDESTDTSMSSLSSPQPCTSSSSSSSRASTPCTLSKASQSPNISSKWYENFEIPWDKMPVEVQSAIANSKRPAPDKRRQMIRILADEIRKCENNPTRNECLIICRNIVKHFPNSFADMTPSGVIIGSGCTSLLCQLKTRIENMNRAGTKNRLRTSKVPGQQHQRPSDSYGCTQFNPELPPEETYETLEQKRQQLETIYRQEGIRSGEKGEVINLMKTTFCLQRRHINQAPSPSIEDMRIQWPYLFTQRGIFIHFELLTDINVLRVLDLSIKECGQGIRKYLQTKSKNKDVQSIVTQDEDGELTLIQLLMAYFDEGIEGLILRADISATAADVESTLTIPASPRLILLFAGDEATIGGWMITIENHVICEGVDQSIITGLAAVFSTYYIFNLQYQEEASRTLEFVQRRFIGLNPERGTKASQVKVISKKTGKLVHKKTATVNVHVANLIKNLLDFEWGFVQ
ncbi:uncharacterized protein LOC132157507 [Carassius carassius]|uniref:uncharacterized protein LOC132092125 n=1 Tax=Carassius carassius TaxID=217509 RepID=UPI00286921C5|nr:uncharacterized protein LOC132092125 [Carassius carassius]XP_059354195.1 uncharacterized protein LOC132092125 [Carassius carassius]XP_059360993.1 uncharacterized protein LOC132098802 [Carassius carassius]XP_059361332.1 uncharacterized protein LOC132099003 [Carassius carassius]XP_059361333.1 uncharacterized protein LOC132099003 [Carassius carassius]XP_059361422.1 uncharacterized protein LOC132099047 [Carassius carassius]XP_059361947.1 uncharacterized protein LOC132101213 [Carassius carassiu